MLMQKESKKVIEWKQVKKMQRKGTRLRGNEKFRRKKLNQNIGGYSDMKGLKDGEFINQCNII